jgi:uncharacterized membrane protein YhaH (DUF805 family)
MRRFFYSNGKEKEGPFFKEELQQKDIQPSTLIWFEGLDDWTKAEYVLEIKEILELSPPPIKSDEQKINLENVSSNFNIEYNEIEKQNNHISYGSKPKMFREIFLFEGRIRRMEYGLSLIFYIAYYFIITIILLAMDSAHLLSLLLLPGIIFLLAQGAKRCHDLGNSGWFQIIPLYGFWMIFQDGVEGNNRYGINPKGR